MILYLKPEYKPNKEICDDLIDDSLTLLAINMTKYFYESKKRLMTEKDIDKITKALYDKLRNENALSEIEWNQTS